MIPASKPPLDKVRTAKQRMDRAFEELSVFGERPNRTYSPEEQQEWNRLLRVFNESVRNYTALSGLTRALKRGRTAV
jgi:hypothetical protein